MPDRLAKCEVYCDGDVAPVQASGGEAVGGMHRDGEMVRLNVELPSACQAFQRASIAPTDASKWHCRAKSENVGLSTRFSAQTGPTSHSDNTYDFPARKICAIKGMTLETDGGLFLNRWNDDIADTPSCVRWRNYLTSVGVSL